MAGERTGLALTSDTRRKDEWDIDPEFDHSCLDLMDDFEESFISCLVVVVGDPVIDVE
jgi:hypothetical protein